MATEPERRTVGLEEPVMAIEDDDGDDEGGQESDAFRQQWKSYKHTTTESEATTEPNFNPYPETGAAYGVTGNRR